MKKNKKINIAIIGFGRFGELYAKLLLPFGNIHIISSRKIKSKGMRQIEFKDLRNIEWVIPAVPISKMEKVLKKLKNHLKPGALVMDVCSVKVVPCRQMKKILPSNIEILGTHPMFGPDSAKKICKGLQVVVCPVRIKTKTFNQVLNVFKALELKIIKTTAADHDRQAARSLALVHFIGRGLSRSGIKEQRITTLGFERLLAVNETVNNDTWELFLDMNQFNPYIRQIRKNYIKSLSDIDKKIISKKYK